MDKQIISNIFEQHNIRQRTEDGYISATDMCKAFNREFSNYNKVKSTTEYIEALDSNLLIGRSAIIQIKKGGIPVEQGVLLF